MSDHNGALRQLPSVDRLLRQMAEEDKTASYPRGILVSTLRAVLSEARAAVREGGEPPEPSQLIARALERLERTFLPSLRPVINATGVIIHTNLGRAPLSFESILAILDTAGEYSNLEFRLDEGARGSRHEHVSELLRKITGAEDAITVNNNASAVLLILSTFAPGREVVVSRGQAVEIGGGFRIPDVLRQSGAKLVEVGTTNRTYLRDYEEAITPETALLLHVHPSNFRVEGFVHSVAIEDLVELGRKHGIPVVDDLGSGSLLDTSQFGLAREPMVQERIAAGVDLVSFSGDKLLGGPQAGIIAGKAKLIEALKRHPLARAIRVDKMTIAALTATLLLYLKGEALSAIPIWRMISMPLPVIDRRASRMVKLLQRVAIDAVKVDGFSTVGGGSLPGETLPTRLIAIRTSPPQPPVPELAARLRRMSPPVVARIEHEQILLDPRTIEPDRDKLVVDLVGAAAGGAVQRV